MKLRSRQNRVVNYCFEAVHIAAIVSLYLSTMRILSVFISVLHHTPHFAISSLYFVFVQINFKLSQLNICINFIIIFVCVIVCMFIAVRQSQVSNVSKFESTRPIYLLYYK